MNAMMRARNRWVLSSRSTRKPSICLRADSISICCCNDTSIWTAVSKSFFLTCKRFECLSDKWLNQIQSSRLVCARTNVFCNSNDLPNTKDARANRSHATRYLVCSLVYIIFDEQVQSNTRANRARWFARERLEHTQRVHARSDLSVRDIELMSTCSRADSMRCFLKNKINQTDVSKGSF